LSNKGPRLSPLGNAVRKLSLAEATALGIGIIIGASIFSLVGVGAKIAGSDLLNSSSLQRTRLQ